METFVVRVWPREGTGDPLRGVVRHVRTGREIRFSGGGQLVDLLSRGFPPESAPELLCPPAPG